MSGALLAALLAIADPAPDALAPELAAAIAYLEPDEDEDTPQPTAAYP